MACVNCNLSLVNGVIDMVVCFLKMELKENAISIGEQNVVREENYLDEEKGDIVNHVVVEE